MSYNSITALNLEEDVEESEEKSEDEDLALLRKVKQAKFPTSNKRKKSSSPAKEVQRKKVTPMSTRPPTSPTTAALGTVTMTKETVSSSSTKEGTFTNSTKWAKDIRPPHLQDDEVLNSLSIESACQQIMQWTVTKAMLESNELKKNEAESKSTREKPDEDIKKILVESGEDDATETLHNQRFCFRTPLKDPSGYWALFPKKWSEINKSVYLDHLGLETICSPRVLELLHDRTSHLKIKMFLSINANVGMAGAGARQNLWTLDDGSPEIVSLGDWLSATTINMVLEALDNLVALWTVMWPGEWGVVVLRRVVTKHKAFIDITNGDVRRKVLEAFIDRVLYINSSHALRGKPPLFFAEVDKIAEDFLMNKRNFKKQARVNHTEFPNNKSNRVAWGPKF